MAKPSKTFFEHPATVQPIVETRFADLPTASDLPFQSWNAGPSELAILPVQCVRLDLEDIECFEAIDRQFQRWGVQFNNAVAIRPSNPAFPAYSGSMVMMGSPKSGWIEAKFDRPVQFVSGFVTSSRRTVLAAFDNNNRLIARTETSGANLAGTPQSYAPNLKLSLNATNIQRVTFHAFDGELTLDDICFSF